MKIPDGDQRQPDSSLRVKTPVAMLKEEHKRVKELLEQFEKTADVEVQRELARKTIDELKIHAEIEEELFYPSVRKMVMNDDLMNEAAEEHHVVRVLIDEIDEQILEAPVFHAKFVVLAETVRHHIKQEETRMLSPLAGHESKLQELGVWMAERRQELQRQLDAAENHPNKVQPAEASSKLHAVPSIIRMK